MVNRSYFWKKLFQLLLNVCKVFDWTFLKQKFALSSTIPCYDLWVFLFWSCFFHLATLVYSFVLLHLYIYFYCMCIVHVSLAFHLAVNVQAAVCILVQLQYLHTQHFIVAQLSWCLGILNSDYFLTFTLSCWSITENLNKICCGGNKIWKRSRVLNTVHSVALNYVIFSVFITWGAAVILCPAIKAEDWI